MDVRKLLVASLLIAFAVSTYAQACDNENPGVGTVTVTAEHSRACAVFEWSISRPATHAAIDFNNYVVTVAGGSVGTGDYNTDSTEYKACTVEGGETITINVMAYDGNKLGYFCSNDANTSIRIGESMDAARLFVYNIFIAMAAVVSVIIIAAVALVIFGKKGVLKIPGIGGK